jgi:thiol-disulfide isomerase/thioredoxin
MIARIMYDLEKLIKNSEKVSEYISASSIKVPTFKENYEKYALNNNIVDKLKRHKEDALIFAFSAEWCPDCQRHIPTLGLIADSVGIEVNIFGHLMRDDPKSSKSYWRIPPSPPEVEEFNVKRIPTILILDKKGRKIGDIIENPPKATSLEKAILEILESEKRTIL